MNLIGSRGHGVLSNLFFLLSNICINFLLIFHRYCIIYHNHKKYCHSFTSINNDQSSFYNYNRLCNIFFIICNFLKKRIFQNSLLHIYIIVNFEIFFSYYVYNIYYMYNSLYKYIYTYLK